MVGVSRSDLVKRQESRPADLLLSEITDQAFGTGCIIHDNILQPGTQRHIHGYRISFVNFNDIRNGSVNGCTKPCFPGAFRAAFQLHECLDTSTETFIILLQTI